MDKQKLEHLEKAFKRHLVLYGEKQRQQDKHIKYLLKQQVEFGNQLGRLIKITESLTE